MINESELIYYGHNYCVIWLDCHSVCVLYVNGCVMVISPVFSDIDDVECVNRTPKTVESIIISTVAFLKPCASMSQHCVIHLIAIFMGPTWGPPGAARTQVGPMLATWTLLSGISSFNCFFFWYELLLEVLSYTVCCHTHTHYVLELDDCAVYSWKMLLKMRT